VLPLAATLALVGVGSAVLIDRFGGWPSGGGASEPLYLAGEDSGGDGQAYTASGRTAAGPVTVASAVAVFDGLNAVRPGIACYGVAVLDRNTGQVTVGADGATTFYSASVVKVFTVVDVLHRAEAEQRVLTADQYDFVQRALSRSDDNAMNALWDEFGGSRTITEMIGLANLRDTRPPTDPNEWGETLVSARDVVGVYQYALTQLSQIDQITVLGSLASAPDVGADGFDQAFGLLHGPRAPGVAAKQGWMVDGPLMYLHSAGVTGRYVVALLSRQPAQVGYQAGKAELSAAATNLVNTLQGLTG